MKRSEGPRLLTVAMVLGFCHAAASLYWALGGSLLLGTVGEFAVRMHRDGDAGFRWMLGPVGVGKAAAALIPWADHLRPPPHRWIRAVSWVGAIALIGWGALGAVGGWIGIATGSSASNRPAQWGHAILWDPVFLLWGLALAGALWLTRRSGVGPTP